MAHTPTPWWTLPTPTPGAAPEIMGAGWRGGRRIAKVLYDRGSEDPEVHDNAAFIVTACNAHDDLLAACKALPLDAFPERMGDCDAADFKDHAGAFFAAMRAARAALAKAKRE